MQFCNLECTCASLGKARSCAWYVQSPKIVTPLIFVDVVIVNEGIQVPSNKGLVEIENDTCIYNKYKNLLYCTKEMYDTVIKLLYNGVKK